MRRILLVLAALLASLAAAPAAGAVTHTVNQAGDAPDTTSADNVCDSSGSAGLQCTLRAAIQQSNAAPPLGIDPADTIVFAAGVPQLEPAAALPDITGPLTIDGGGDVTLSGRNVASGAVLRAATSGVAVRNLVVRDVRGTGGVVVGSGARQVTVSRSPIFALASGARAIAFEAPGSNDGVAAPGALRVGPRQADGSVPIRGSTDRPGTLEIFRGDPAPGPQSFYFDAAVGGGEFQLLAPAEPVPGERFAATLTDGAGSTSEFSATARVPDDLTSPDVLGAYAVSNNDVVIQLSEPLDPGTVQPEDFTLEMADVGRPIVTATPSGDGTQITLTSPSSWFYGEAGTVRVNAPGVFTDAVGNASIATPHAPVGASPGDFAAPVVSRLRIKPASRICLVKGPKCKRAGATVVFLSSEDGDTWFTVRRADGKAIGTRRFAATPGGNYLRWDGKIRGRRLRDGVYTLTVAVEDVVGNRTPAATQPTVYFSVKTPKRTSSRKPARSSRGR